MSPNNTTQFKNKPPPNFVPRLMIANTMSLVPKVLEVEEFLLRNNVDIGFITETWLKDKISDSVVKIQGYKIVRRDRSIQQHGRLCVYIKNGIKFEIPDMLQCCDNHEVVWLKLKPNRLPHGFCCIMIAVVYHPPGADHHSFMNHLSDHPISYRWFYSCW